MATGVRIATETQLARRRRKNAKRKLARRLCAEGRALPPVVGFGKAEYIRVTGGTVEEYDAYCEKFVMAAKKARRRWEFPMEPLNVIMVRPKRKTRGNNDT